MANSSFPIVKQTDRQIFKNLQGLVKEVSEKRAVQLTLHLGDSSQIAIQMPLSQPNEAASEVFGQNAALVQTFSIGLTTGSLSVQRKPDGDRTTIHFPNDADAAGFARLLGAAHKHLRARDPSPALSEALGPELSEFYQKRESALAKLEDIAEQLITDTADFRRNLDKETSSLRLQMEKEATQERKRLQDEFERKQQELRETGEALEARSKELDDRSSRHARRQLRQDLKTVIAARGKGLSLTKSTVAKRRPIHALFILLIGLITGYLVLNLIRQPDVSQSAAYWIGLGKSALTLIGLSAMIIFYIRWNDQWFHQHADEEFRLQRLELDIDRASWIVEMALEWRDEKGSEIPPALLARLSENLFTGDDQRQPVRHPSEDLASALLGASSGLTLRIPGLGEASLNRKGIQNFKKAAEEISDDVGRP